MDYNVIPIKKEETHEWLLRKHYAKRIPSISHAFGLYNLDCLEGVITFGMPPNYVEMMAWKPFNLLELNRLVVNDGTKKNAASFFISSSIKKLPRPSVLISYADFRMNHFGYVYQATNWIYTGVGGEGCKVYIMKDMTERHQRHDDGIDMNHVLRIEKTTGKARYFYFHGTKKERKEMLKMLRFNILPYPKGNPSKYDASYEPITQRLLFQHLPNDP